MRIALLQDVAVPLDLERNLRSIREAADRAKSEGCELLLTPELYVSGYAPRELAEWLTAERVSGIPSALAEIATTAGIAVAASFPLARADGSFTIAAGLWDASGDEVLRYEKVHLWDDAERSAFVPATELSPVASWNGRRVGFQICYDIEFPEPARLIAANGADLLLVPTAITEPAAYIPEILIRARAAENALVVAYADHASTAGLDPASTTNAERELAALDFAGRSVVAGREAEVFASAGAGPELLIAEIPDVVPIEGEEADYLADRRPELYAGWGR